MYWNAKVFIEEIPRGDRIYQTKTTPSGRSTAYFYEDGGYVSFFVHDPNDESGFAGRTFSGKLEDGSEFSVRGPWSSSASAMTRLGFPPTLDVSVTDEGIVWERGYTFYAGSVTVEWFRVEALPFLPGFELVEGVAPYLGDRLSAEQAVVVSDFGKTPASAKIENVPVFSLQPKRVFACRVCRGEGYPCRECRGSGIDVAATVKGEQT